MNTISHSAGFSLIEVMVAILILGVALVGMTHGVTTALESSKDSELQTTAALFAAGKIETLRAESDFEGELDDGETSGNCGTDLKHYDWKQTVSATDIDGLHEVDVTVETAQNHAPIYTLKTLLFVPPQNSTAAGPNANANPNRSQRAPR